MLQYEKSKLHMLQDLFKHSWEHDKVYDPLFLIETQLKKLFAVELITQDQQEELRKKAIGAIPSLKIFCDHSLEGMIPFMICPNPSLFSTSDIISKIDLREGKIFKNTFYLEGKKVLDLWLRENYTSQSAHIVTGINICVSYQPNKLKLKKSSQEIIEMTKITGQAASWLTFYEVLLLGFYYPEIFDIWDGIEALGSGYGEKFQILRLYWLNQKPDRYIKVAREDYPLLDSRFMSPKSEERIII